MIWLLFSACQVQNPNKTGKLTSRNFEESLPFEEVIGLAIVPVQINGRNFRFLFDTGAPNAISKEIQNEFGFKVVKESMMRDSEESRRRVRYVKVNELSLGSIHFRNVKAFVADFSRNPAISCLNIDGIIGSPLMRHCSWQINFRKETILITDRPEKLPNYEADESVSFGSDRQYSVLLSVPADGATLNNLKLDYGSNGGLSISENSLDVLEERGLLDAPVETWLGFSQSGLYGELKEKNVRRSKLDCQIANANIERASLKTSQERGGLIGTEILKNYIVTINFPDRRLHLSPIEEEVSEEGNDGLGIGWNKGMTKAFSIRKGGSAWQMGIKPGDTLVRIGDYPLKSIDDFCNYVVRDEDATASASLIEFFQNGIIVSDTLLLSK